MYFLPEEFKSRMKKQLPEDEWEAFFRVYEIGAPIKGLRINTLKISIEEFKKISPFTLKEVPWEKNGFYVDAEKIGGHPYHFAGLYYSQEPSAMYAAPLLEVKEGEKVLDLCSAPGGKGTRLAESLNETGIIVMNEPIFSRAQILSSNVERMGIKNAVVTNEKPEVLSKFFGEYFDKILIDAPCSGEGMFRKNAKEETIEWSKDNIHMCAERQKDILNEGVKMLKVGGKLVYSTCTFAKEEDENQVLEFLNTHSEMSLISQEKLYPHKIKGEGHFCAVFEKTKSVGGHGYIKEMKGSAPKVEEKVYREFEEKFFIKKHIENLYLSNEILYKLPEGIFDFKGLHILRAGIRLGEVVKGRFEPSHSLAMCTKKDECRNVALLNSTDKECEKFLRGETIENGSVKNGWCLVCVDGYPIGMGKASNGQIKNHIPKPLRKMS